MPREALQLNRDERVARRRRVLAVLALRRQAACPIEVLGVADVLGGVRRCGRPDREGAPPAHARDSGDDEPERDNGTRHSPHGETLQGGSGDPHCVRVLVTGGGGFVGSHLVERLQERGDDPFFVASDAATTT